MKRLLLALLLTFANANLMAAPIQSTQQSDNFNLLNHMFVESAPGFFMHNKINDTHVVPSPIPGLSEQRYLTRGADDNMLLYKLKAGFNFDLTQRWSLAWGLSFAMNTKQDIKGEYYLISTQAATQTYSYTLSTKILLLEADVAFAQNQKLSYIASLGAGQAWLDTSAASFKAIPSQSGTSTPYTSAKRDSKNAAFMLGLGASYRFAEHWSTSVQLVQYWLGDTSFVANDGAAARVFSTGRLDPLGLTVGIRYSF